MNNFIHYFCLVGLASMALMSPIDMTICLTNREWRNAWYKFWETPVLIYGVWYLWTGGPR